MRQFVVNHLERDGMTFVCPLLRCPGLPSRFFRRCHLPSQVQSVSALVALDDGSKNSGVPDCVKVGPPAHKLDRNLGPPAIILTAYMKGLMNVPDEMHDELQGFQPLGGREPSIEQIGSELLNFRDNAATCRTVSRGVVSRHAERDVDNMPRC